MPVLVLTILIAIGGLLALELEQPLVLAGALVAPIAIWTVFQRPLLAFAGAVVVGVWNVVLIPAGLPITPYKAGVLLILGLAVWRVAQGHRPLLPTLWLSATLAALAAIISLSELNSDVGDPGTLLVLGGVAITAYFAWQVLVSVDALRSMAVVLALGQLWMAQSVWAEVGWSGLMSGYVTRAGGLAAQPNASGLIALCWFFMAAPLVFDRNAARWQRLIALVSAPAFVYVVFGTASRSVTAATAAGLLSLVATQISSLRNAVTAVVVVVVLGPLAYSLAPDSYLARMEGTVEFDRDTGQAVKVNDSMRRDLATSSLVLIAQKPILGGGLRGSETARFRAGGRATTTHSTYLRMADSYGVPALLLLLFAMARTGFSVFRLVRFAKGELRIYGAGLFGAFIALTVFSISSSSILEKNVWFLIAVVCAVEGRILAPQLQQVALAAENPIAASQPSVEVRSRQTAA